jgi:hypothetical protein
MTVLAIDPGNTHSGYALIDEDYRPRHFGKESNTELLMMLPVLALHADVAIELIGHYGTGMPAGRTVFDTCIWIGRFIQRLAPQPAELVLRATVKTHLCGSPRANDANVTNALLDRFAPNERNHGKGTKAAPGFFHGFRHDVWQAFALAVQYQDTHRVQCLTGQLAGQQPLFTVED